MFEMLSTAECDPVYQGAGNWMGSASDFPDRGI